MMYQVFVDGSARNNRCGEGIGAWGFVVLDENENIVDKYVCAEFNTTNNRCEMLAIINTLKWLDGKPATIYSDSNLVCRGINEWMAGWKNRGWRKADKSEVLNKDLWVELDKLLSASMVSIIKTSGHAGVKWNEYVDKMVQNESLRAKENDK